VEQHVQIVQTLLKQHTGGSQVQRRGLERRVRQRALEFADRLNDFDFRLDEAARRLGIKPRTLRHWDQVLRQPATDITVLGRPRADTGAEQQQRDLQHLKADGPGVSVPTLRAQFPDMARAELDALLKWYRHLWRAQHPRVLRVLHWQRPGTVWAMDFAEAPSLIDGIDPYLLAVRDLASGQQLLWRPVVAQSAEVLRAAWVPLFLAYGAPWVLKSDNGPAFRAVETKRLLAQWEVGTLCSPPHTPAYKGAIEAAIGSLKRRTERGASMSGHPERWTSGLVEAARREANATAQPRRLHGATPTAVWDTRARMPGEQRARFRASVERYQTEGWEKRGGKPADPSHWDEAAVDRVALRRALVAHDLLLFARRSIPAQIKRPKVANKG
jgi:hypothetical protein